MKGQIEIQWDQAQELAKELTQREKIAQENALNEFKDSFCDSFSIHDWMYYEEKTGKSISELRSIAKYKDDEYTLNKAVYSLLGSELDADDLASLNL